MIEVKATSQFLNDSVRSMMVRLMLNRLPVQAKINISKPYKPRKLKTDQYHRMLRQARQHKPKNSQQEAKRQRSREKWLRRNATQLKRRAQIVRERRRAMGLS